MSFISSASFNSKNRGYDYYQQKKLIQTRKINHHEFEGIALGSNGNRYKVRIDLEHPKKNSHCTCPHASDNRVMCKHKVGLYFTLFPLLFDGQTIGKKICKIKLSSDKGKLTFRSLLIRVLFYPIFTNIILYTTLSNILTLVCVILFKGKIYFYSNLIISIIATIYSYIDILFMINKDVSIHEKLSHTKVELIKGV